MINRILALALHNRLFVILGAAGLLIYGGYIIMHLPVDVFPDLNRPTVTVMTEAPGLAPEEIEALVSLPLETSMNGAPGVERVRSASAPGLSILFVEFGWGTDIYRDRQLVSERLQLAGPSLPSGVVPAMGPVSSIMGEIALVGVQSPSGNVSPGDLRNIAEKVIGRRLLTIPGVSQVISIGGGLKQYVIQPDPQKLASAGLDRKSVV